MGQLAYGKVRGKCGKKKGSARRAKGQKVGREDVSQLPLLIKFQRLIFLSVSH